YPSIVFYCTSLFAICPFGRQEYNYSLFPLFFPLRGFSWPLFFFCFSYITGRLHPFLHTVLINGCTLYPFFSGSVRVLYGILFFFIFSGLCCSFFRSSLYLPFVPA